MQRDTTGKSLWTTLQAKTSFEQNGTFQKRLTDIFVDKLLQH